MVVEIFHFYSITFRKREKFYSFSTYSKTSDIEEKFIEILPTIGDFFHLRLFGLSKRAQSFS